MCWAAINECCGHTLSRWCGSNHVQSSLYASLSSKTKSKVSRSPVISSIILALTPIVGNIVHVALNRSRMIEGTRYTQSWWSSSSKPNIHQRPADHRPENGGLSHPVSSHRLVLSNGLSFTRCGLYCTCRSGPWSCTNGTTRAQIDPRQSSITFGCARLCPLPGSCRTVRGVMQQHGNQLIHKGLTSLLCGRQALYDAQARARSRFTVSVPAACARQVIVRACPLAQAARSSLDVVLYP